MSYRVVYPVAMPIDANDFREAVKKFIKLNHFMNIEQMILTDQYNHMRANIKYYDADRRRKASIQLVPMDAAAVAAFPGVVGFSSTNPKTPYPAFAVGPSQLGGPAGIIAPAGPLMVERPAMIGGPVIGGPRLGLPVPGPVIMGPPGGPGVAGVIYGARPAETTSDEIIRIDDISGAITATTKDGSTFPISKIEKLYYNNTCRVFGSGGKISIIKTQIIDGNRIVFQNKKYKPSDEEDLFDITDIVDKPIPGATPAPSGSSAAPSSGVMTVGPTAVITPSKQIIPVAPVGPIGPVPMTSRVGMVGTDGRPVVGVPVPFGAQPSGVIGMSAAPGVVVGGPMMVGSPVRFGRGVY